MSDHKRNPTALKFTPGNGAAAPARVRDASGHVLDLGDEVLLTMPKILMRVADIRPLLHPGAPPNVMALTLVCQVQISVPRDTAVGDVWRTRLASAMGDGAIPAPQASQAGETAEGEAEEPAEPKVILP